MSKELTPLEASKELTNIAYDRARSGWTDTKLERHILDLGNIIETELKNGEKEHKALEIIKRSPSDAFATLETYGDWEEYYEDCIYENVTTFPFNNKEEFDLLMEVFGK